MVYAIMLGAVLYPAILVVSSVAWQCELKTRQRHDVYRPRRLAYSKRRTREKTAPLRRQRQKMSLFCQYG